jgi:hypothetical protein
MNRPDELAAETVEHLSTAVDAMLRTVLPADEASPATGEPSFAQGVASMKEPRFRWYWAVAA